MLRIRTRMKANIFLFILSIFFILFNFTSSVTFAHSQQSQNANEPKLFLKETPENVKTDKKLKDTTNDGFDTDSVVVQKAPLHSVPKYLPDCSSDEAIRSRNLFLVSTLDGNLSAVDAVGGKILWTTRIAETLLSSTISDFMINAIGETVRIVPSLDGNLFMHNGRTIRQTQYSAEKMLRKSLKFTDNVILVGGKDSQAIGIDLGTGEIIYECGLKSCSPGNNYSRENVIVLRRNFQSIRAINILGGAEDWHFQVNDPEIVKVSKPSCHGDYRNHAEAEGVRLDFKIAKPCGLVRTQVFKSNISGETMSHRWTHKFNVPIVKFWHLQDGKLDIVDLFDKNIIEISDVLDMNDKNEPQLYIGSYNKRLYVQKSVHYRETVSEIQEDQSVLVKQDVLNEKNTAIIQVKLKPKLAIEGPILENGNEISDENQTQELATVSGFPFHSFNREDSTGYYVFRIPNKDDLCDRLPTTDNETMMDDEIEDDEDSYKIINVIIKNSLFDYKLEIFLICFTSWFFFHNFWKFFQSKFFAQRTNKELDALERLPETPRPLVKKIEHEISVQTDNSTLAVDETIRSEMDTSKTINFSSRFYEDFNPVSQLGKGGFGVVFEAQHKIDGKRYAVKRVAMPTKAHKREKYLREVVSLSNLEHPGIIRYYNAWIEEPPPGWQDEKDKEWSFEFSKMEGDTYFDETNSVFQTNGDSLVSFRNDANGDSDDDSLISFRDDEDSRRMAGDSMTSGSESDDEAEDQEDDENDCEEDENENNINLCSKNNHSDESGSDIVVFEEKASRLKNVNWDISVISKQSEDSSFISNHKNRKRKTSEKDANAPKAKIYVYIQMQLCKKITLKDWMMNDDLRKQNDWLHIFTQILSAVDYVHDKKLIHRDLKPSNIFFSMDDTVKIGDFGLVTSILDDSNDSSEDNNQHRKKTLKHTNEVGTHIYMSPEQINKKPYNHKVDIFSIGIILYELLDHFRTESERFRKLESVRKKEFPIEFKQKYQNECKILEKLLSINPEERPEAREILLDEMFQNRLKKNSFSDDNENWTI